MFPQLDMAKYGMQLLGVLAIMGVVTGGYYYIKHKGAVEQSEKDMTVLADRNAKESAESIKLLEEASEENAKLKEEHAKTYVEILTHEANTKNIIIAQRDAALAKLRERQRTASTKSDNNTESRKADLSKTDLGTDGGISEEARITEKFEVVELSEKCLGAAGFIRQNAEVK